MLDENQRRRQNSGAPSSSPSDSPFLLTSSQQPSPSDLSRLISSLPPSLGKRHGFKLDCKTCGVRNRVGGYENVKQFAKVVREHQRIHRGHDYKMVQSFHAAELQHIHQEKNDVEQTTTSATYVDFTGNSIPASSFTAGKKYLLVATAQLRSSATTTACRAQMVRGTTVFPESVCAWVPQTVTSREIYSWFTVFTQPVGGAELVKCQISNSTSGTTTGIDQFNLVAIKLSDDLVENTDWKFAETTTSVNLAATDSTQHNASVNIVPTIANEKWLCLARARMIPNAVNNSYNARIVRSGEAASTGPFSQREGGHATLESHLVVLPRVYTLGAASNTFEQRSYNGVGTAGGSRSHSGIFILNLSKLRNSADSYDDTSVQDITGTAWTGTPTNIRTITITPDITGDVWCWTFLTSDQNALGSVWRARMRVDDVDQPPTQTSDNYSHHTTRDSTDEPAFNIQTIENLSGAAAHTVKLDAVVNSAVAGKGARAKFAFAVTMELAAAAGGAVTSDSLSTVGITETAESALIQRVTPTTDAVGITESVTTAMTIWFTPTTDPVNITESVTSALIQRVTPTTDAVGITETTSTAMTTRSDLTEPVGITESVTSSVSLRNEQTEAVGITETTSSMVHTRVSVPEPVGITEDTHSAIIARVAPTTDSVGITETAYASIMVEYEVTEPVGITEAVSVSMGLANEVATDPIGITETTASRIHLGAPTDTDDVGILESVSVAMGINNEAPSDTVGISEDTHAVMHRYVEAEAEPINITEDIQTKLDIGTVPTTDPLNITEDVHTKLDIKVAPPNTLIVDFEPEGDYDPPEDWQYMKYWDDIPISENVSVAMDMRVTPPTTDNVGISENITSRVAMQVTPVTDVVNISEDTHVALHLANEPEVETVSITEEVYSVIAHTFAPPTDEIAITEAVHVSITPEEEVSPANAEITEEVGIEEAVAVAMGLNTTTDPEIDSQIAIAEQVLTVMHLGNEPEVEEVYVTEDVHTIMRLASAPTTDQTSITESVSVAMGINIRPPTDPITITETTASAMQLRVTPPMEQLTITEQTTTKMQLRTAPDTDNITIEEDIQTLINRGASITNPITIEEDITVSMGITARPPTDPIAISENVQVAMEKLVTPTPHTDNITISEAVYTLVVSETDTSIDEHIAINETVHTKIYRDITIIGPAPPPGPPPSPPPPIGAPIGIGAGGAGGIIWSPGPTRPSKLKPQIRMDLDRYNRFAKRWRKEQQLQYKEIPILLAPPPKVVETYVERPKVVELESAKVKQFVEKELIAVYNIEGAESIVEAVDAEVSQIASDVKQATQKRAQEVSLIETERIRPVLEEGAITSEDVILAPSTQEHEDSPRRTRRTQPKDVATQEVPSDAQDQLTPVQELDEQDIQVLGQRTKEQSEREHIRLVESIKEVKSHIERTILQPVFIPIEKPPAPKAEETEEEKQKRIKKSRWQEFLAYLGMMDEDETDDDEVDEITLDAATEGTEDEDFLNTQEEAEAPTTTPEINPFLTAAINKRTMNNTLPSYTYAMDIADADQDMLKDE